MGWHERPGSTTNPTRHGCGRIAEGTKKHIHLVYIWAENGELVPRGGRDIPEAGKEKCTAKGEEAETDILLLPFIHYSAGTTQELHTCQLLHFLLFGGVSSQASAGDLLSLSLWEGRRRDPENSLGRARGDPFSREKEQKDIS